MLKNIKRNKKMYSQNKKLKTKNLLKILKNNKIFMLKLLKKLIQLYPIPL